ncbi:MAG: radical SAM protein [Anaerolineales bacterium]|nr:radical SAM protein [Anaerolineales bacterium]
MMRSFHHQIGIDTLNLAAFCPQTRAHGPGLRAVVYVQGCPFRCPGCIAPEWQEQKQAELVNVHDLARRILAEPVTGLSLSGGEPMLQAGALANLVAILRQERPSLDIICFTGFQLGQLVLSANADIEHLLYLVDVLIDGPYVEALNNNRGLRGSTNQVVHRLTKRSKRLAYDFENSPRQVEIHVYQKGYMLVGVPPGGVLAALEF